MNLREALVKAKELLLEKQENEAADLLGDLLKQRAAPELYEKKRLDSADGLVEECELAIYG